METEYMTRQGYESLKARKAELERKLYEAGQAAGAAAGPSRDWHDNPAYDQAQEAMRILATQIAEITSRLNNAKIIEEVGLADVPEKVDIGCRVTLEIDGSKEVYFIGGSADSDPKRGIISYKSPLAQAILSGKVGEIKTVKTPNPYEVKILSIERPSTENSL
jgi:transcription elongation GreA/GreB family factor